MTPSAENPPRRRFRASLFTVFATLTVLTLVCSHGYVLFQLWQAIQERDQFYRQFGLAIVYDAQKVSSGATWYSSGSRWRIQVYQPAGRQLTLNYSTKNVIDCYKPEKSIDLSWVTPDHEGRFYIDVVFHAEELGAPEIIVSASGETRRYPIEIPPGHALEGIATNGMVGFDFGSANLPHVSRPDVPRQLLDMNDRNWDGLSLWLDNATSQP